MSIMLYRVIHAFETVNNIPTCDHGMKARDEFVSVVLFINIFINMLYKMV